MTDTRPLVPELEAAGLPDNDDLDELGNTNHETDLSDMEEYDIALAHASLKATKWKEGMVLNPCIGGVSLGKIPLKLTEESGRCALERARSDMMIQSGQAYIPFFKRISCKTGTKKLKDLGALPAMVTNILMPNAIFSSSADEKEKVVSSDKQREADVERTCCQSH